MKKTMTTSAEIVHILADIPKDISRQATYFNASHMLNSVKLVPPSVLVSKRHRVKSKSEASE
jgi:hypothetical protein